MTYREHFLVAEIYGADVVVVVDNTNQMMHLMQSSVMLSNFDTLERITCRKQIAVEWNSSCVLLRLKVNKEKTQFTARNGFCKLRSGRLQYKRKYKQLE